MPTDLIGATPLDLSLSAADGMELKARYWSRPDPRGTLVVAHGLGEHSGAYGRTAEDLSAALDIDVLAFDFRGHGRSPGRRGVVRDYDDLIGDLRGALDWAESARPGLPRFVLGHSNGGVVVLRSVLAGAAEVDGMILSNPTLRLAIPVPRWKVEFGRWLLRHAPGVTLSARLPATMLTRDPESQAERAGDPLRHGRTSAPLYFGMVEGGAQALASADSIRTPTLLQVGGSDPVVDPRAAEEFFGRLASPDKTLHVYPGMLHEPLTDIGRDRVIADIVAWLSPRLG